MSIFGGFRFFAFDALSVLNVSIIMVFNFWFLGGLEGIDGVVLFRSGLEICGVSGVSNFLFFCLSFFYNLIPRFVQYLIYFCVISLRILRSLVVGKL